MSERERLFFAMERRAVLVDDEDEPILHLADVLDELDNFGVAWKKRPRRLLNISRPCYDKMHRCPGWAGGGALGAKVSYCDDGRLIGGPTGELYQGKHWRWRFNRCNTCGVHVLPYAVRYLDWRWHKWTVGKIYDDIVYNVKRRFW